MYTLYISQLQPLIKFCENQNIPDNLIQKFVNNLNNFFKQIDQIGMSTARRIAFISFFLTLSVVMAEGERTEILQLM